MNVLWKNIYKAGVRVRNRQILPNLDFLMKSQHWSVERLREHQLKSLRTLVDHSFHHSSYYRRIFDEAGVSPDSIRHLDDLAKIPTLDKPDLLACRDEIQIRQGFGKLVYSETSGSTGTPLVFYRSLQWDAWHNAAVLRGYSWHGVEPWERNGYLWGFNLSRQKRIKTAFLDRLQNRFRMFSYDDKEIEQFASRLRHATYVGGYSSMLYRVAKAINANPNLEPLNNLKMVKGTSEKIFPAYQVEATKAFGKKIISEYGAAESGIIAFECAFGSMHITLESCIVEIENGEILVTNLVSDSFPIIRYRLGDAITLGPEVSCACGMKHPVIREITGRIGKVIRGHKQDFPSLTLYYVFKNLAEKSIVLNYAARQESVGEVVLRIEQSLNESTLPLLTAELKKYFADNLEVTIVDGADIRSSGRKFRDFVSTLDTDGSDK
ncbi:hypothetical protein NZK35_08890 [Stieleria sp. ICT_E10.1]|uniref:phenylacetate--CoA ligase family protein n=1 Tax=Stieleria sedimenti TaxID=2976331 RepID=UPI0021802629|nr:hypothetical protein [Stieleria sedimenti]MCS7466757.1 hypothetical protein [Stieleria sedimenti]